ncbi:hypothetical protein B1756_07170 [Natrarchaeobaculum aegyptiacum]|uniref:Leucine-binding protein domain-containing protein n=1 Tax=Natrarchaeobaculum aegyptiacum TaxID=745377 RepID=A0A2Z2HRX7_9EURY|nr:hypothetical protein B1756_07170 [Natrarchaeobaculum aegyptiacum]
MASIGVAGLAGCLGGENGANGESPEDADEIVIGCPTALSGAFAPYGEAERDGGILAAQHLEEEFDVSIEIVEGDSEADPNAAVERIEDMVINDGAHMAFGGVSSAVAIATGSWGTENQVPVSVHGGSDDITGAECASYMFSPYMSNSMQVAPTAPAMADLEDEWFLLYSDYTWGHTARDAYEEALEAEGADVIGAEGVPFPETEYGPYLNAAEQSGADGIALLTAGLDQRSVTQEILSRGIEDEYTFSMHQTEDVSLFGIDPASAALLDVNAQGWSAGLDVPEDWLDEIAQVSDHSPFVRHYMGYVSVDQLVRASMRADSLEGEAIRDELRGHVIENDLIYDLQPTDEQLYWREADNQLVQPTYVTRGLDVDDQQTDPYDVWFEVTDVMQGEEASPEPDPECEL